MADIEKTLKQTNFLNWYLSAMTTVVAFLFWQGFDAVKSDYMDTKKSVKENGVKTELLLLNAQQQKMLIDGAIGENKRQDEQIMELNKMKQDKKNYYLK